MGTVAVVGRSSLPEGSGTQRTVNAPDIPHGVTFEERQRMRQPWLLSLVAVIVVGSWAVLVDSLLDDDSGSPLWGAALVVLLFGMWLPWVMWSLELRTVVDPAGLDVRFHIGIGGHHFPMSDMASVRAVTYRPIRDFGGWGVRWGWHRSRAYNVSGDRGVEVIDTDGRRWVIGSQRADELEAALAALGVPVAPH